MYPKCLFHSQIPELLKRLLIHQLLLLNEDHLLHQQRDEENFHHLYLPKEEVLEILEILQ
jgi:hypothetical protein